MDIIRKTSVAEENKKHTHTHKSVKRKQANKTENRLFTSYYVVIVLNKCTYLTYEYTLYMFYGRSFPLTTTQSQSFNPIDLSVFFLIHGMCICNAFASLLNRTTKMENIALVSRPYFPLTYMYPQSASNI